MNKTNSKLSDFLGSLFLGVLVVIAIFYFMPVEHKIYGEWLEEQGLSNIDLIKMGYAPEMPPGELERRLKLREGGE